jgi:acylphosphatase
MRRPRPLAYCQCNANSGPDWRREENRGILSADFSGTVSQELHARRFFVTGCVQGVGYRGFVEHVAGKLGLQGYVRNRRDGRVEVFAMGTPERLGQLRVALEKGPMMSDVESLNEQPDVVDTRYAGIFTIEMTI